MILFVALKRASLHIFLMFIFFVFASRFVLGFYKSIFLFKTFVFCSLAGSAYIVFWRIIQAWMKFDQFLMAGRLGGRPFLHSLLYYARSSTVWVYEWTDIGKRHPQIFICAILSLSPLCSSHWLDSSPRNGPIGGDSTDTETSILEIWH